MPEMLRVLFAAYNMVPSAEEATEYQNPTGTLFETQVEPELVEV
ncbi:MAG: hypothetical protein WBS33_16120 [Verrucomicrobiia bacterium]